MRSSKQLAFFAKQLKAAGYKAECPPCRGDKRLAHRVARAKQRLADAREGRAGMKRYYLNQVSTKASRAKGFNPGKKQVRHDNPFVSDRQQWEALQY